MVSRIFMVTSLILIAFFTRSGASTGTLMKVLYPTTDKVETSTSKHYFIGDVDTFSVARVELSRQAVKQEQMFAKSGSIRADFIRKVGGMFTRDFQLTSFEVIVHNARLGSKDTRYTITYPAQNRVNRDAFWQSGEFQAIYEKVFKDSSFRSIDFNMTGSQVTNIELSKRRLRDKLQTKFVVRFELIPGQNDYTLRALDEKERILEEHRYSFLYKPDVSSDIESIEGFEKLKFHTPAQEQNCSSCHRMKPNASELVTNTATVRMCYPCHAWQTASANVHPPLTEWNCFYCHGTGKNGEGFSVPESRKSDKTCFECHEDMKDELAKTEFAHAPAASGDCLLCHNPHSSDNRGMAIMKPNKICLSCHDAKYTKDHPVMRHPVTGVRDKRTTKDELSCVSCHNPHYGKNAKMFHKATSVIQLCQECHKK